MMTITGLCFVLVNFFLIMMMSWIKIDGGLALTTTTIAAIRRKRSQQHSSSFVSFRKPSQRQQQQQHNQLQHHYSNSRHRPPYSATTTALFLENGGNNDNSNNDDHDGSSSQPPPSTTQTSSSTTSSKLERLKVCGVSVSPNGFHVILQRMTKMMTDASTANYNDDDDDALLDSSSSSSSSMMMMSSSSSYIPIKVTNDLSDTHAATSPESLTLCQLLSGVDMAGTILPPELLSKLVVYHIESKLEKQQQQQQQQQIIILNEDDDNNEANNEAVDADDDGLSKSSTLLSPQEQKIYDAVQQSLQPDTQDSYYKDAHVWFQNRIKLPQITLDQLTLIPSSVVEDSNNNNDADDDQSEDEQQKQQHTHTHTTKWDCRLDCAIIADEWNNDRLILDNVDSDVLSSLVYQYDPETSTMFTCIALALRYKAPIVLLQTTSTQTQTQTSSTQQQKQQKQEEDDEDDDDDNENSDDDQAVETEDSSSSSSSSSSYAITYQQLETQFPQRTTVDRLQEQSTRLTQNIERGFEIHKLQGALTIAMKLGDTQAVSKIRAKLDEYDSMDQLPTTTTTTATTSMKEPNNGSDDDDDASDDDNNNDRLDDLDKNILQ